jgi:HEAT repeat protein
MTDRYEPTSDFLMMAINEEVLFTGGEHGKANLPRLILMTKDPDPINRDWATLLLSQQEMDTPEIRDALLVAAEDENIYVRGEAILGLAQRDKAIALPLLQRELSRGSVALQMFEAATIVADPSLAQQLEAFTESSGDDYLDQLALDALKACRGPSKD